MAKDTAALILPTVTIISNSRGDQIVMINGFEIEVKSINVTKYKGQPLTLTLSFDANLMTQHSDDFFVATKEPKQA